MRRRAALLAAPVAAAALALAACGGDGGGGAGLDVYAPADSAFFVEVAVRPEGDLGDSIDSILGRFPGGDELIPRLRKSIDDSLQEDGLSYEDDIEPWLGERLAIFGGDVGSLATGDISSSKALAFAAQTTDSGKAIDTIRGAAEDKGPVEDLSYEGVDYFVGTSDATGGSEKIAAGIVDGVLVFAASEAEFKAVVDAQSSDGLAGDSDWSAFADGQGDSAFALAYVDLGQVTEAAAQSAPVLGLGGGLGSTLKEPLLVGVEVEQDAVTVNVSGGSSELDDEALAQSSFLNLVPDGAWLGVGLSDIGQYVTQIVEGAPGIGQVNRVLRRRAGFDLSDLEQLGDGALYVEGESLFGLGAGAVVEMPEGAARDRVLRGAARALRGTGDFRVVPLRIEGADGFAAVPVGTPIKIDFATSGDRIVVGLGDAATRNLLSDQGGSDVVDAAEEALGGGYAVNLFVEIPPILSLADTLGASLGEAQPYLEQFSRVVVGSRRDGDREQARVVVELE